MFLRLVRVLLVLALPALAVAADKPDAVIRAAVEKSMPGVKVTSVNPSPVPNIYEVVLDGAETAFVSGDGQYLISGDLYKTGGKSLVNLTEQKKGGLRRDALAKVKADDMIVFPAKGKEKGKLYVFTDVDCGYCRKLHQDVPQLNAAGITVNYLAFPRSGTQGETFQRMVGVWCAVDRQKAITDAKRGRDVPDAPATCRSPVEDEYRLGVTMGVRGTPAVFLASGEQVGGYVPPGELINEVLKQ